MKSSFTILVAEDNADDLFLLEQAFRKAGVTRPFHTVRDGLEAIAYLQGAGEYADRSRHPFPDMLLLDLNMPRCNGFEVLEWVRASPLCSRLMVHVISASIRPADVHRAYDLRANSYIVKPTRLDDLIAFVGALHGWHQFAVFARMNEEPAGGSGISGAT